MSHPNRAARSRRQAYIGRSSWATSLLAALLCAGTWGCSEDSAADPDVRLRECPAGTDLLDGECVVLRDLSITPRNIGPALVGQAFTVSFETAGGEAPYTYSLEGSLPEGLVLNSEGTLAGTPTEEGQSAFAVTATDSQQRLGKQAFVLEVQPSDCVPEDEVCDNGLDDDCDGQIDEDCEPDCVPTDEICDNDLDDDCDGQIDEGCDPDCVPEDEVCDGQDNDCDGDVDEEVLNACGECGEVPEEICDNGLDDDCDGAADEGCDPDCVPEDEVCDGQDNDCDGDVDEEVLNACGECGEVPQEICGNNEDDNCDGEVDEDCVPDCVPVDEICDNGIDDDCDGVVDDDCVPDCVPEDEVCDGQDNDCDGDIDEESVDAGGACGQEPGVCQAGTLVCNDGALVCEGIVNGTDEVCDGIDNDCDGAVDEDIAGLGQSCALERCGYGVMSCEGGREVCAVAQDADLLETVSVEGGLVRSYSGTDQGASLGDATSWSILIASDGERIYNVSAGINNVAYAGFTVRIFVPGATGLALEEEITIPVDWDDEGAARTGIVGVSVLGDTLLVNHIANEREGAAIWALDLTEGTAEVMAFWDDTNTGEGSAEYDWTLDRFWTLVFNETIADVFLYGSDGIDPGESLGQAVLRNPDSPMGNIASDGRRLYLSRYDNQQNNTTALLTVPTGFLGASTQNEVVQQPVRIKGAASSTYHSDGYLYVPDQEDVNVIQRVAVTHEQNPEVCDGLDNDCDGEIDNGDVCNTPDLRISGLRTEQLPNGEAALNIGYTTLNRNNTSSQPYRDRITATRGATTIELELARGALGAQQEQDHVETLRLDNINEVGQWTVAVEVDVEETAGDLNRENNTQSTTVFFAPNSACTPDRFENNDTRENASELGRRGDYPGLTLCFAEEDWYYIDTNGLVFQRIILEFDTDEADLDLYIFRFNDDGDFIPVTQSNSDDDEEQVTYRNGSLERRRYYIKVERKGTPSSTDYELITSRF